MKKKAWMIGAAGAVLAIASGGAAHAQNADEPVARAPVSSEEIVVPGQITYRNRSESTAPVLEYGLDYFQRFEPSTVGDMLKRVPSAAFTGSDVGEYDNVQLRGLGAGYTQVLINGERVPGQGGDRTFFVDRIPAEVVERVEIIRNTSASRSGDAVAGAVNIILRDGYSLDGGYLRAGVINHDEDGENEGILGAVYGGALGEARYLVGASYQGRHNAKNKFSRRYDEPGGTLDNVETQSDVRDGEDYSFNGSIEMPVGQGGEMQLAGVFVKTDREEIEDSAEFEGGELTVLVPGYAYIEQENYSVDFDFKHPFLGGEIEFDLGFASFDEDRLEGETETAFDAGAFYGFEGADERLRFTDEEMSSTLAMQYEIRGLDVQFGVDYNSKERSGTLFEREFEYEGAGDPTGGPNPLTDPSLQSSPDWDYGDGIVDGGDFLIEEVRIDPFVQVNGDFGAFEWEAGLRYETTDVDVTDRAEGETQSNDYAFLLPSAHLRWNVSDRDRVSFSVGRTVRRPGFRQIAPTTFGGEYEDNDFIGNPALEPENAWGVDVGFERRLGRSGVFGVNVFYRDIKDVIETYNTGVLTGDYLDAYEEYLEEVDENATLEDFADEEDPVYNYSVRNTGDASVWGIEFDLSTPLTVIGLENTGLFLNYSWLDSEIDDEFGTRRINNQTEYVFNIGFIHTVTSWDAAFGATYREQGDSYERVITENVTVSYSPDLELFAEKSFGERFTLRFTASNLLDVTKDEVFNKFDNAQDQIDRDFDEYELETENTGPVYQLIGRMAF